MFKTLMFGLIIAFTECTDTRNTIYGYGKMGLTSSASISQGTHGYDSRYGSYGTRLSHSPGPLHAAIQTKRYYSVVPVHSSEEPIAPQVVEVSASKQPVKVIFRTKSSPVHIQQKHTPAEPTKTERTHSVDEPHKVYHEVLRPVIQEFREVVQPYRRVTQVIKPVVEEVTSIVHKDDNSGHNNGVQYAVQDNSYDNNQGAIGLQLGGYGNTHVEEYPTVHYGNEDPIHQEYHISEYGKGNSYSQDLGYGQTVNRGQEIGVYNKGLTLGQEYELQLKEYGKRIGLESNANNVETLKPSSIQTLFAPNPHLNAADHAQLLKWAQDYIEKSGLVINSNFPSNYKS